jgi:hypothetical protein
MVVEHRHFSGCHGSVRVRGSSRLTGKVRYGREVGGLAAAFFCLSFVVSFVNFLVRSITFGTVLGGGRKGACNGPPAE